jgi:serine/threonine protein kinase/regulator of sirC expression with transglutaminase-like and TPR domain
MTTDIDSIVEAYDQARADGASIDLRQFFPVDESQSYRDAALELMRVDMEYSWQAGEPRGLDDYLREYRDVFADPTALSALAFEEYRLRRAAGERATREEYSSKHGVDSSSWPEIESPVSPAKFPAVGNQLLGFRLVRELGRGAFARVYLADQADLAHRHVALKVTTELTAEPERLAQLQHPNIVPIYSVHRHRGMQLLCMPFFGERTLRDWLRLRTHDAPRSAARETEDARLADTNDFDEVAAPSTSHFQGAAAVPSQCSVERDRVDESLRILHGIALGLAHAHRCGFVHRDLKPANVLLRDDGTPLVLDFNLAANVARTERSDIGVGGTLPYMSPEQILSLESGEGVDAGSDVYACGVLLVEMLTGKRPFPDLAGRHAWKQARDQRLAGYREAAALARVSSADVASIVTKCLAPQRVDRYRSGEELAEDLRRQLEHLPLRYAANRSPVERLRKWARRHPRLGSAGGVATAAAVCLLIAATMLYTASRRTARMDAARSREEYMRRVPELRAALTTPHLETALARDAIRDAEQLLAPYHMSDKDWRRSDRLLLLADAERDALLEDLSAAQFELTAAQRRLAALESGSDSLSSPTVVAPELLAAEQAALGNDAASRLRRETTSRLVAGDYQGAVEFAERFAQLAPHDFEAQFLLGNALVGYGESDEAERRYSVCAALMPSSPLAYFQRGVCRLNLKRWAEAEADFSRVLKGLPVNATALVNRAVAREAIGNLEGALQDLTAAIPLRDVPTRAYLMRARLFARLGRADEAQADRERGLTLVPRDPQSWVARGTAQLPAAPELALQDFQAALRANAREANAWLNIAHVQSECFHRPQEAIDALASLLEFRPRDADALAGRAVLYARLGNAEAALADLEQLKKTSQTAVHQYQAACVYALIAPDDVEQREQALGLLAAACRIDAQLSAIAGKDPDLKQLRNNAEFQRIVEAVQTLHAAKAADQP